MIKVYDELRDQGFEILAVNLREKESTVAKFAKATKMHFPIVLDGDGKVGAAYYARGIPTSVFVDRQGIIGYVHMGALAEQRLRSYVDSIMQETGS